MKKTLISIALVSLFTGNTFATTPGFFKDKQRGWFWWETPPEEPKEEPPAQLTQPPLKSSEQPDKSQEKSEKVVIGVQWLKDNLPKLEQLAVENPTETNLANYAYAQRLSLDYASRFSTKMMEYMASEPLLNEERRRPTTSVALTSFNVERGLKEKSVIKMMAEKSHLWFFYRSDCPYCHKQIPILKSLQKQFGFEILAVSMDGLPISGAEEWPMVVDEGLNMTRELQVVGTPTLYLVSNEKEYRYPLTSGLESLEKISNRINLAAKETGVISEEEYNQTKYVIEENVFEQEEPLEVEKKEIEDDPSVLTELLRRQLKQQLSTGI